jgi:hypothetical protein
LPTERALAELASDDGLDEHARAQLAAFVVDLDPDSGHAAARIDERIDERDLAGEPLAGQRLDLDVDGLAFEQRGQIALVRVD